jgi:hypothetical protein
MAECVSSPPSPIRSIEAEMAAFRKAHKVEDRQRIRWLADAHAQLTLARKALKLAAKKLAAKP